VDGEVVGGLVHCSTVRYAIIQASSKKDDPERLVIAYPTENCLRDLIAAPSIIGFGFTSREEAMAKLLGRMPDTRPSKQERRAISMSYNAQRDGDAECGCGLIKNHRISCHILQCALASISVFFYSRNLFSVLLRAALGFSS
jgi:hypothetical protein